jgi:Trk-type K+ transport system membrane component
MMKLGLTALDYGIILGGIVLMFCVSLYQEKKGSVREALWEKPVLRYILVFVLLVIVLLMGSYGIGYNASDFIYNQF